MTVKELIVELESLPEDAQDRPVQALILADTVNLVVEGDRDLYFVRSRIRAINQ